MQQLSTTTKQSWLVWFLKGVLILGTAILLARVVELQVIKGNYFYALAEDNRIRHIPLSAPRGEIYARGGEALASNIKVQNFKQDVEITEWKRTYPLGSGFVHLGGYLGEINQDEVGKVDPDCNDKGPRTNGLLTGRGGLEQQYECILRGIDGEELVEVDTHGKKIRTLGTKAPVSGNNLQTTIDFGLQKKAADVMRLKGAVIVTDGMGEVLAFYSHPSFDPYNIEKYLNNQDLPLFNRVISGSYHPGSLFKIVTAASALSEGKIDEKFKYDDQGVVKVNEFEYKNWFFTQYGKTEGIIGLQKALARSTDTFFYKIGEFVGADALAKWANKFGLGDVSGIDLPGEVAGLVPTPVWKKRIKNESWFLGNTYHMSIGQGDLTTTPLQANLMTSVVANGGKYCKPHIKQTGEVPNCINLDINSNDLDLIKQGMVQACTSGGTGYPFFDFKPAVACKTGTAETEDESKTHAWFTVFAPAYAEASAGKPEIVVTVLVEKGGEGSAVAAPIAKDILEYWFHER